MTGHGDEHGIASVAGSDERLVVRLAGELSHGRSAATQAELVQLLAQRKPRTLVLNLAEVTYMDSSGIALLLVARRRLGTQPGAVTLVGLSEALRGLLRAVKIETLFPMADTEEAADVR